MRTNTTLSHISLTRWEQIYIRHLRITTRKFVQESKTEKSDRKFKETFALLYDFDGWLANELYNAQTDGASPVKWSTIQKQLNKVFNRCRGLKNDIAAYTFLSILQDIRDEYDDEASKLHLYDASNFIHGGCLYYCGLKMPVEDGCAFYTDENGKRHTFPLQWDWWFEIEYYYYLEKGWKS